MILIRRPTDLLDVDMLKLYSDMLRMEKSRIEKDMTMDTHNVSLSHKGNTHERRSTREGREKLNGVENKESETVG